MKIITSLKEFKAINDSLGIIIGNFDGCHLGHFELINTIKTISKKKLLKSCVLTLEPHPNIFIGKNKEGNLVVKK